MHQFVVKGSPEIIVIAGKGNSHPVLHLVGYPANSFRFNGQIYNVGLGKVVM